MKKLMEAELERLSERARDICRVVTHFPSGSAGMCSTEDVCYLCAELARLSLVADSRNLAITAMAEEQDCGHPGACMMSDDEGASYCGWCASLEALCSDHRRCISWAGRLDEERDALCEERDGWRKSSDAFRRLSDTLRLANDRYKAEADALRKKLKATKEALDGAAETIMGPDC